MKPKYFLTPTQTAVLRTFTDHNIERSNAEIAVHARLLPHEVRSALAELGQMGLIQNNEADTEQLGVQLHQLTREGCTILNALKTYRGQPQIGTVMPVPSGIPAITSLWPFGTRQSTTLEITPEVALQR